MLWVCILWLFPKKQESEKQSLFEHGIFFGLGKKIEKYDTYLFWGSALTALCGGLSQKSLAKNIGFAGMALSYGFAAFHRIYLQNLLQKIRLDLSRTKPDKEGEEYKDTSVIVIDDFDTKYIETFGLTHGELVQKYITENLPGVNVKKYSICMDSENRNSYQDLINTLKNILKDIKSGKKYDAINMSFGLLAGVRIKNLRVEHNGKKVKITRDNMEQYKTKLRDAFIKNMYDNKFNKFIMEHQLGMSLDTAFRQCDEIRDLLKQISDKGVKIFLANNNSSRDMIFYSDLFDIDEDYENANNPNIITVSSSDDEMKSFALSDIKESSNYELRKVRGGIDITEDDIADIAFDENIFDIFYYMGANKLEGNSFGSPTALSKWVKKLADKQKI